LSADTQEAREDDMSDTTTITVHCCEVCGDHAEEKYYDATPKPRTTHQIGQTGIFVPFMAVCPSCGLLACWSCLSDGHCCDRRAEIEREGMPKVGQMRLFDQDSNCESRKD
jgi:hypothetical protein